MKKLKIIGTIALLFILLLVVKVNASEVSGVLSANNGAIGGSEVSGNLGGDTGGSISGTVGGGGGGSGGGSGGSVLGASSGVNNPGLVLGASTENIPGFPKTGFPPR